MEYIVNGIINNYGFCIKKQKYDTLILNHIKNFLILKPIDNFMIVDKKDLSVQMYYEDDKYLVISKFVTNHIIKQEFELNNIKYINIKFKIDKFNYKNEKRNFEMNESAKKTIREYQQTIINDTMNIFDAKNKNKSKCTGGIWKISCGGGKTYMAIYLACLLGLKTLIVVPKNFLIGQWTKEITSMTNATVGMIKRDKVIVENKDFVIASMKSLSKKNYDPKTYEGFGLVIYDEVHNFTSKLNSNSLLRTNYEYTLGLSATPENIRGLDNVLHYSIGNIISEYQRQLDFRVIVKKINFRSDNPDFYVKKRKLWNPKSKKKEEISDVPIMINDLMNNDARNNLIVNIISYVKSLNRNIFVFSSRIEHLTILKDKIDKKLKEDKEEHIYNTYFYTGPTKECDREKAAKDGNILCCSSHLTQEGLNIKGITTLIYALPFNNTDRYNEQSSGRIIRNDKLENLLDVPMIIDFCDLLSNFSKWSDTREQMYSDKNYYQQTFNWHDTNYVYKYFEENEKKDPYKIMFDDICDEKFIEEQLVIKKTV